jgi:hypothetical protein
MGQRRSKRVLSELSALRALPSTLCGSPFVAMPRAPVAPQMWRGRNHALSTRGLSGEREVLGNGRVPLLGAARRFLPTRALGVHEAPHRSLLMRCRVLGFRRSLSEGAKTAQRSGRTHRPRCLPAMRARAESPVRTPKVLLRLPRRREPNCGSAK